MVYADIGPNTATKADKLPISLHDDKVQYAELKQIKLRSQSMSQNQVDLIQKVVSVHMHASKISDGDHDPLVYPTKLHWIKLLIWTTCCFNLMVKSLFTGVSLDRQLEFPKNSWTSA